MRSGCARSWWQDRQGRRGWPEAWGTRTAVTQGVVELGPTSGDLAGGPLQILPNR